MDMREAAAMTEASGLTDEQGGRENYLAREMELRHPVARFSEQLRKMTLAAPLPSLFIAFLLGILVARRR
jgi:hypothetical protein